LIDWALGDLSLPLVTHTHAQTEKYGVCEGVPAGPGQQQQQQQQRDDDIDATVDDGAFMHACSKPSVAFSLLCAYVMMDDDYINIMSIVHVHVS